MNPFGDLSSSHSTWPITLTILNLPPHLCHKRRHLLLTMLISGPRQPGNDIDVLIEPVMEEMTSLWKGVDIVDASTKKKFALKAIIILTITDYPGLFSLSGQIKGKTVCTVCIDRTYYKHLKASCQGVYMRHRRFLCQKHRYQQTKMDKFFDNEPETLSEPEILGYGPKVFDMVKDLNCEFGKKKKEDDAPKPRKKRKQVQEEEEEEPIPAPPLVPFKKQSIFFKYLEYWKELVTPHAIDCMHLEKNVFESTFGLLLDMKFKTKDGLKSRLDLKDMEIREEIQPIPAAQSGNSTYRVRATT